jgi:Flp pilus assembly pilin Flp
VKLWPNDSGQGLAEYGIILGLIALTCVVVVVLLGANLSRLLTHIGSAL